MTLADPEHLREIARQMQGGIDHLPDYVYEQWGQPVFAAAARIKEQAGEIEELRRQLQTMTGIADDNDRSYCVMRDALESTREKLAAAEAERDELKRLLRAPHGAARQEAIAHAAAELMPDGALRKKDPTP